MIWKTRNGRFLARHGIWRPWYAWHPVKLEPPIDSKTADPLLIAWLVPVWRIGVIVAGQRFFLYRKISGMPEKITDGGEAPRPRPASVPRLRVVK